MATIVAVVAPRLPLCRAAAPDAAQAQAAKEAALAELQAFAEQNKRAIADAEARLREAARAAPPAPGSPSMQGGGIAELTQDDFWQFLDARPNSLTIVDIYTDFCGPCKLIYPELVKYNAELAAAGSGAQIVKVNASPKNRDLGRELGAKVAPTFIVFRGRERLGTVVGAKIEAVRALVDAHL